MRFAFAGSTVAAVILLETAWGGALQLVFDHSSYSAQPGEVIQIGVYLDTAPPAGLFSYGLKLAHPLAAGQVISESSIVVPAELDFYGVLGSGALRQVGPDFAGVKGTVDFFLTPPAFYPGTALGQFEFVCGSPGEYALSLHPFLTLGPSEEVFVTGDGDVLDPEIQFGSARLVVLPEPAGLGVMASLAALVVLTTRRLWVLRP